MPHLTSCACRINANTGKLVAECTEHSVLRAERDRLQLILDSRPAINTGLLEAYIEWTQGVYLADFGRAVGHN